MTAASDQFDLLITTSVQALARVQAAWMQALSDVWLSLQDALPVETNVWASNQTEVDIPAQPNATTLVMSALTRSGSPPATITPDHVTIVPLDVPAGTPRTVVVTVFPPAGTLGGTYQGTVKNAAGVPIALAFVTVTAPT